MKWSLQQLSRYRNEPLKFSGKVRYDEYAVQADMIRLDEVSYHGTCIALRDDYFRFDIHIETTMYLEDSRTLEEVAYPINMDITEYFGKDPDDEDSRYIEKNTVDLYDVIWETILLEKPMFIIKAE